jgi:hypothetical protein
VVVQPEPASVPPSSVTLGSDTASFSGALPSSEATSYTVHLTAPGPGVQITAPYGADDASIRSIQAGARMTARSTQSAPAAQKPGGNGSSTGGPGPELSVRHRQGLGIGTGTAPSVATMTDWPASSYRVIGTCSGSPRRRQGRAPFRGGLRPALTPAGDRSLPPRRRRLSENRHIYPQHQVT